eukprot:6211487-Pleurochrysis_carterae.AAC.2
MDAADTDGDGMIDFGEYRRVIRGEDADGPKEASNRPSDISRLIAQRGVEATRFSVCVGTTHTALPLAQGLKGLRIRRNH